MPGQRRGGFVHDHQPRLGGDGARNRDALADRQGQIAHDAVQQRLDRVQAHLAKRGGGGGINARPVEQPQQPPMPGHKLFAKGDVLGHGQVRQQRQVLIDRLDPRLQRLPSAYNLGTSSPSSRMLPSVGAWAPDMILMTVLLPQPFSPSR